MFHCSLKCIPGHNAKPISVLGKSNSKSHFITDSEPDYVTFYTWQSKSKSGLIFGKSNPSLGKSKMGPENVKCGQEIDGKWSKKAGKSSKNVRKMLKKDGKLSKCRQEIVQKSFEKEYSVETFRHYCKIRNIYQIESIFVKIGLNRLKTARNTLNLAKLGSYRSPPGPTDSPGVQLTV